MSTALLLLAIQGLIGAFDTIYNHEYRARLPARGRLAAPELRLHAARSLLYGVLFCTLPFAVWAGAWTLALCSIILAEIVLTLWDFVIEIKVRRALGDVYAGERVTHAIMGILYGAMITCLIPTLLHWARLPSSLSITSAVVPGILRCSLLLMGIGVTLSGLRDLYATMGLPGGSWPWKPLDQTGQSSGPCADVPSR